ncbi:MAG TPA: potassium channel family protein [Azospirillum sp.]|nr:potassium channel family protein [Azospirillum sp.]
MRKPLAGQGREERATRRPLRRGRILHVRSALSPERTLAVRAGIIVLLLCTVIAIFWFDREGLKDNLDDHVSFGDILYFTMITVTTVGYGDMVPVSTSARLIDAFAVTPIRIFIWFIFLGTAYEFVVQKIVEDFRMSRLQKKLNGHIVLCGYGHSGLITAHEMLAKGHPPERIVAIDLSEERVRLAAEAGYIGLRGDATSEELLTIACVQTARAVVVSVARDDTAVLVILTARHLSKAKIVASIKEEENAKLAKLSGADLVITPAKIGGYLLADAVETQHATPFLCDLMSTAGQIELNERPAAPAEVGKTMADVSAAAATGGLVVQVHSQGRDVPFSERHRYVIRPGDMLLLMDPAKPAER